MPEISISIDSKAAQQLFQQMPQRVDIAMRGTMEDSSSFFLARMKDYPAKRPGSSYVRTGTLMRSWNRKPITRTSSGWQIIVGSNGFIAPYNRYVQDRDRQARIHRGRWQTAQDEAERGESQVQRFADQRFRAALEGL